MTREDGRWRVRAGAMLAGLAPAARELAGRRYYVVPLIPLLWPLLLYGLQFVGDDSGGGYTPAAVPGFLVGLPLALVGLILGTRMIAVELEQRTLEISYTVPGGAHRIWAAKLIAAAGLLLAAALLLGLAVFVLLTGFPVDALVGAFEAGLVFLALGAGLGAWFRGWISGSMAGVALLLLAFIFSAFPLSPFWSPLLRPAAERDELLPTLVRHRIGHALLFAALVALAFGRAQRREKMLR